MSYRGCCWRERRGEGALARSAASEQPSDRGHHLFGALVLLLGLGADHARVRVPVKKAERDLVERRLGGAALRDDVDAIAVVLYHSLDPTALALDALQPSEQLVFGGGVAPGG